jgi:hypothetical protein
MDRTAAWYPSFADVPGLDYRSPLGPNYPLQLEHGGARAGIDSDGAVQRQYLLRPSGTGESSVSPAQAWATTPRPGKSAARPALRQLHEALDLPGTLSDYHVRLQGCCSVLWRARLDEPEVLSDLEHYCLLDLQVIETSPAILAPDTLGGPPLHVTTCDHLITLFEHEGMLREALAIAERGQRLHQDTLTRAVERVQARVAQLDAEESEGAADPAARRADPALPAEGGGR